MGESNVERSNETREIFRRNIGFAERANFQEKSNDSKSAAGLLAVVPCALLKKGIQIELKLRSGNRAPSIFPSAYLIMGINDTCY